MPFVLIATGIVGVDSRRARVEGSVVLESCTFLIESSTFAATDYPGLQPGRRIDFDEMGIAAADERLTLINTLRGAKPRHRADLSDRASRPRRIPCR